MRSSWPEHGSERYRPQESTWRAAAPVLCSTAWPRLWWELHRPCTGEKTSLGGHLRLGLLPAFRQPWGRRPWERWRGAGSDISSCEHAVQVPLHSHCTRREGSRRDCFRFIKLGYRCLDAKHLKVSVLPLEFLLHLSARLVPPSAQTPALF